jgi:glycosyltransferase involved in cell wall biosynthesis
MLKVGHIIGQLSWGGAERQLFELATRIEPEGFLPFVYCLSEDTEPYAALLESRGVPVRVFPRRSHFDPFRVIALRKALKKDAVDLAHAWLLNDDAYTALAHLGNPRPWIASMRSRPLDRDRLRKQIDRWTFARACHVVANEAEVIAFLDRELGCPPSKVSLVPNGIDLDRLKSVRTSEEVRAELGTPPKARVILFAGRLEEVKNLPMLLEAFYLLLGKGCEAHLWIAGDGNERAVLEERVLQLELGGRVRVLGVRRDLPDLFHAADLFALTSHSEGLPNVVLEAMGCGTPAIVSPHAGCGDLIRSGENGWISPRQDPASYAALFEEALASPERLASAGEKAKRTIRENYSVDVMVSRMAGVYRRQISR